MDRYIGYWMVTSNNVFYLIYNYILWWPHALNQRTDQHRNRHPFFYNRIQPNMIKQTWPTKQIIQEKFQIWFAKYIFPKWRQKNFFYLFKFNNFSKRITSFLHLFHNLNISYSPIDIWMSFRWQILFFILIFPCPLHFCVFLTLNSWRLKKNGSKW